MVQLQLTKIQGDTKTLTCALEGSFKRFFDSVAIETPQSSLTYAQLDDLTLGLASKLQQRFSADRLQSEPIAILMSRSIEFYVAQVAVLRAGGFFLPIDPAQPSERIEFLLSDSQASLLLVRTQDKFEKPKSVNLFSIDFEDWKQKEDWKQNRQLAYSPDDAVIARPAKVKESDFAYMIYTSGSSGQPKGVPISHRSIWNLCDWWSREFGLSHTDRTLQMFSLGFDASLEEILPTLVTGGTLVPVEPDALDSIFQFLSFVRQHQINVLHFPTAFWHTLAASLAMPSASAKLQLPPSVSTVVFGGEQVDPLQVEAWFSQVGSEVRLINAYGPTEATIAASYAVLEPNHRPSIGKPIVGASFYVVGEDGQLVEEGQTGELYISGVGLAEQYWRREQLSAEKFVRCDFHAEGKCYRTGDLVRQGSGGNYEFVDRMDDQIKLRGYRIEPGEIAKCLGAHPGVSRAHVVARRISNTRQLVGYVVAQPGENPSEVDLINFVKQRLPAYMVPTGILLVDSFPVTPGGKLDLKQFPKPIGLGNDLDQPLQTPTEQATAKIWEKVLGVTGLGREDNFFQLGGDSLLAMRLVLTLESAFPGPAIPVASLIPNPSVRLMADFIDQRRQTGTHDTTPNQPLMTRLGDADGAIRVVYLHAAGGGGMFYHELHRGLKSPDVSVILESAALYAEDQVIGQREGIQEIAKEYVDCIVEAGCEKEITLVGYSFGGIVGFEMIHQLKQRGITVDRLINIDAPNPEKVIERGGLARLVLRLRMSESLSMRYDYVKGVLLRKWQVASVRRSQNAGRPPAVKLRSLALELELIRVAKQYVPLPCDVPMHLICGEDPELMYSVEPDYGWTSKVPELTVTQIPGGHATLFDKPYLGQLIKVFCETINTSN